MTPLYLRLLSFSGDILTGWMESMLHLRDIVNLETALVYRSQRMRISRAAQNITNDSIIITSYNVRSLVKRNAAFADVKFGNITRTEDVILASEILRLTRTITLEHADLVTDDTIRAVARGSIVLESLYIKESTSLTDKALWAIAQCKQLRHLELKWVHRTQITRIGWKALFCGCALLESFSVSRWNPKYSMCDDFLSGVAVLSKNLKTLKISCPAVSDSIIADFAKHCPSLTSVAFARNKAAETTVKLLIQHCPALLSFSLIGYGERVTPQCFMLIATHFTALTSLRLCGAVPNEALQRIGQNCGARLMCLSLRYGTPDSDLSILLWYCHNLTETDFTGHAGLNADTITLLAQQNQALQVVNMTDCDQLIFSKTACDKAIRALADHCPQLRRLLTIPDTAVQLEPIVYLLQRCPHVYDLTGWYMFANDSSVLQLALYSAKLITLHLVGSQVSNDALIELSAACPLLESLQLSRREPTLANKSLILALAMHCRKLQNLEVDGCDKPAATAINLFVEAKRKKSIYVDVSYFCNGLNYYYSHADGAMQSYKDW